MTIRGLAHMALAVRNLDRAKWFYGDMLGLELTEEKDLPEHGIRVAFLRGPNFEVELMQPLDPEGDSAVARFLREVGEGVQHVAFSVDNVGAEAERMAGQGVWVLPDDGRAGARGERIRFVHPASTSGVVVELIETGKSETIEGGQ